MKIIFLTNNSITYPLLNWLKSDINNIVIDIKEPLTREHIEIHLPDLIISYNYKYIISENILNIIKNKIINLHISYLPWNKGAHPNLWSFLENTPKGVSIHLIDKGIDTGDILLQKIIEFDESSETLKTTYSKLHQEIQNLFIENWQSLQSFSITPQKQASKGSYHNTKDFQKIYDIVGYKIWDISLLEFKKLYLTRIKKAYENQ